MEHRQSAGGARRAWLSSALFAICVLAAPGDARTGGFEGESARTWTLADIVEAPEVTDLAISSDGRHALYVVREASLDENAATSRLYRVELSTGSVRELAAGGWMGALHAIPEATDWSILADLGSGVQLYRVGLDGTRSPLIVNLDTDRVGAPSEGPRPFGISDYGWSADGRNLWYERRVPSESVGAGNVVNPRYLPLFTLFGSGEIELRVREEGGRDILLDRVEAATGGFRIPLWDEQSSTLSYWVRDAADGSYELRRWPSANSVPEPAGVANASAVLPREMAGLQGGRFEMTGYGDERRLIERLPAGEVDYSLRGVSIGDPRAPVMSRSPDGRTALLGFVTLIGRQYGLFRARRDGTGERVAANGSLTNCSVNISFTVGICIQESVRTPPVLVRLDPSSGGAVPLYPIAAGHESIAPLTVVERSWVNRHGFRSGGYVVYPRGYRPGRAYPVIVVTHASDADDTFLNHGFQWEFPIQVLAERGYVILALNEPARLQSAELDAAWAQWSAPGPLPRERLQDLVWLNAVDAIEDALRDLAADGIADLDRVGIAGYSRGSQIVNVAMTRSAKFRAASSGDGGYLEPNGHSANQYSYGQVFGGSPFDPQAIPYYRRLSPTFRAAEATGPILQQVAGGTASQLQFHVALRSAGIPAELSVYPDETHLFHQPRNRLAAMRENIAWFDFWLRGITESEYIAPEQAQRWEELQRAWRLRQADRSQEGAAAQ